MLHTPKSLVIVDVDGLRRDVFLESLTAGKLPHIAELVGGEHAERACHVDALSCAPSITFAAQASIVTGNHPAAHRVAGNELFDRIGHITAGKPRHFGFDVGDTLAVDDAVAVFSHALADRFLSPTTPTLYEVAAMQGLSSVVAYHMYARGAQAYIAPRIVDIARFTKGRGVLGLEAGAYDSGMLDRLIAHLQQAGAPDILMAYFMGLDHHSHLHGPGSQADYLQTIIDPQVGRLTEALRRHGDLKSTLFVFVSDHGQIEVVPDDAHSLRLGFPFDREFAPLFKALSLDLHDYPGEDPRCDAVLGLNGGLAHVYLQHRQGHWADFPRYAEDVLPVAQAFYEMNASGRYQSEFRGVLDLILLRDAAGAGWAAEYRVYQGDGNSESLASYLDTHPELSFVDAANRLRLAASAMSGDLILVARGRDGYYFGAPLQGVHGGLLPGESEALLTFVYPYGDDQTIAWLREVVNSLVAERCAAEGQRRASVADLVPVARALLHI